MAAPTTSVSIYLPTSQAVTSDTINATVTRGRTSGVFDAVDVGGAQAQLNNEDRDYDPLYAASPFFGHIIPGKRFVMVSGGVTIYDGDVADWGFSYDVSGRSIAVVDAEDDLALFGRAEFDEWTTINGELAGARIAAVLARPEVNYTDTVALDDGITVLVDDFVSWGSNVLNYIELVAQTDNGLFYVSRTGVPTYKDRHAFIGVASAATFGTGGIGFSEVAVSYGRDQLYNRVVVERSEPVLEDAPIPIPQSVSDATSITTHRGTFTLSLPGLLFQDDDTALDLATQLLSVYKDPLYRFESITVEVHGLTGGEQTTVLGLDLGSVVTVTWTPNGVGSALTRTCIIEGIYHSIMPMSHVMVFTLNDSSIAQTGNFYLPGHATFGVFSAGGATNYPIAF